MGRLDGGFTYSPDVAALADGRHVPWKAQKEEILADPLIVMPTQVAPVQPRFAPRAVEARKLQQGRPAACAGQKRTRACRNPAPPTCAPQGLSRREGRHSRRLSAIGLTQGTGVRHMKTLRTTLNLRKHDVRRLLRKGYEIEYIETRHLDNSDETVMVWTRQTGPDDLAESEVPF
jgi:hypothetical protein